MQYFTFLGVGSKRIKDEKQKIGYDEAYYYFDKHPEEPTISHFVQLPIIQKYLNELTDIFVFATEDSQKIHGEQLKEVIYRECKKNVEFIIVEFEVGVDEILKIMDEKLCEDFIVDVTHCFRNIPIEFTFVTRYLEKSKQTKLLHLYYGKYNQVKEVGVIYDLIKDYNDSKITNAIESFDKFLRVDSEFLNNKDDIKIQKLIEAFYKFNHMMEYCEFDESVIAINKIYEFSQSVLKEGENYVLLVPYLTSIQNKLKDIYSEKNDAMKKIKLIRLLLHHNLIQIGITFTDQIIREELIHYCYFPNKDKIKEYDIKTLGDTYNLSQDLLYELGIRKKSNKYKVDSKIEEIRKDNMQLKKNISLLDKKNIDNFYKNIRNVVNHGGKIQSNIDINNIIEKCISSLEKFIMEG